MRHLHKNYIRGFKRREAMLQRHVDFLLSQPSIYFGAHSPLEEEESDYTEEFCCMQFERSMQPTMLTHTGLCIHWYEIDMPRWFFSREI